MEDTEKKRQSSSARILEINGNNDELKDLESVTKALGSDKRLAILQLLGTQTCSVLEIAEALSIPQSTATQHINILEKAGLITTDLMPAKRGLQKICARVFDQIDIHLPTPVETVESSNSISMPLGAYVDAQVRPNCGLASERNIIGEIDQPLTFFDPDHIYCQLLWFRSGYVEYRFPNHLSPQTKLESIELSFEVCSEAPLHHNDWLSDITLWINGGEIGTWTSPADFGGERGFLTPDWWSINNTQYGLLKVWKITTQGSFVDGIQISDVSINDVLQNLDSTIQVRIGVKEDAHNLGGINLFGRKFGNYPQDILLKQNFMHEEVMAD